MTTPAMTSEQRSAARTLRDRFGWMLVVDLLMLAILLLVIRGELTLQGALLGGAILATVPRLLALPLWLARLAVVIALDVFAGLGFVNSAMVAFWGLDAAVSACLYMITALMLTLNGQSDS